MKVWDDDACRFTVLGALLYGVVGFVAGTFLFVLLWFLITQEVPSLH